MNLHEISNEYLSVMDKIEEGEVFNLSSQLDAIKVPLETKAINLATYINTLDSNVTAIDNEINRLNKIKKSIVNKQQYLLDYLDYNMRRCGIEKIESPLFSIKY